MASTDHHDADDQPTDEAKPKGPDPKVDEALDETFPASDPPSYSRSTATPKEKGHAPEPEPADDSAEDDTA